MSEDATNWLSWLALAMSGIGIVVSLSALRASSRSAIAAEKSAQEAQRATNIAQMDLLADHFLNVDYIFDVAEGKERSGNYKDNSSAGKQSVRYLRNIIRDKSFHDLLDEIVSIFDDRTVSVFTVALDGSGREKLNSQENRALSLREPYEEVKRNSLGSTTSKT